MTLAPNILSGLIPKFKDASKIKLAFLKWSALHRLLSGIVGKSMFIISLAVPLSKLAQFGIDLSFFPYLLIGAVLVSICYILEKIFIPEIIEDYVTSSRYAACLIDRYNETSLDYEGEFNFLNDYQNNNPPIEIAGDVNSIKKFLPIQEGEDILGIKSAIYKLSVTKFKITDNSKVSLRAILTTLLILGFFFFYFPILKAIFYILTNL